MKRIEQDANSHGLILKPKRSRQQRDTNSQGVTIDSKESHSQQDFNSRGLALIPKKSRPIGETLLAPIEWAAKSVAWLTNPTGGARFAMYGLSLYCFLLSVESLHLGMGKITGSRREVQEQRFVPKVGIDDGADILRLVNPFPVLEAGFDATRSLIPPFSFFKSEKKIAYSVWLDPSFYMALALCIAIQAIEARALRQLSLEVRKRRLEETMGHKMPDLSPKSLTITKVRAVEYQNSLMGGYIMKGLVILAAYGIEFAAFGSSNTGKGLTQAIYGVLTAFGFEFCWNLARQDLEEMETE